MTDNLYNQITPNIWHPNSPDLNPLVHYMRRVVDKEVNEHPYKTNDSFTAVLVRIISDMNKKQLIRACNRFQPRIVAVVDSSGDFSV